MTRENLTGEFNGMNGKRGEEKRSKSFSVFGKFSVVCKTAIYLLKPKIHIH
jgi:hypothetical protein